MKNANIKKINTLGKIGKILTAVTIAISIAIWYIRRSDEDMMTLEKYLR